MIAPSLIPKRSGVQRKHDTRDAVDLARLYRAGELVAVRIPSEAEGRVRDVVRCRETFQREILKSRHYILKFLSKRGFVFRDGTNWCTPHGCKRATLSCPAGQVAPYPVTNYGRPCQVQGLIAGGERHLLRRSGGDVRRISCGELQPRASGQPDRPVHAGHCRRDRAWWRDGDRDEPDVLSLRELFSSERVHQPYAGGASCRNPRGDNRRDGEQQPDAGVYARIHEAHPEQIGRETLRPQPRKS